MISIPTHLSFLSHWTLFAAASGLARQYRCTAAGRPRIVAASADSVVKLNRYRHAGLAQVNRHPGPTDFFGRAHMRVWAGDLPPGSSATDRVVARRGGDTDLQLELDTTMQTHCHPRLSCAREHSSGLSILDEHGLTGLVCSHGQPLTGGFLAMPSHERFDYYDQLLADVLAEQDMYLFYLDIGCTYMKHWPKIFGTEAPRPTHIKVPWWHGKTHGVDCFTVNSGLYLHGG
jgi:hypothetical protein